MDEYSDKEVKMTQRELTFIKATQWDKGWRWVCSLVECLQQLLMLRRFCSQSWFNLEIN